MLADDPYMLVFPQDTPLPISEVSHIQSQPQGSGISAFGTAKRPQLDSEGH